MITNGQKTSLLVPYQLPEFIRDNPDYSNFVLFLQAYYEWMEQNGNTEDRVNNLLSYTDIDSTTNQFISYFQNDFLQYFPKEILADKQRVIKLAKQLYQSKGTPASFQFFFRVLYNSDVDFFYTKDAVLKASSGKWYISKSLKLLTTDLNFLETNNLRIFGETTKSIATIENSVLAQNKIEIFISNIERLFQSGEFVRIVDGRNQDVYFLNGQIVPAGTTGAEVLIAKIVGQISQIKISSSQALRGNLYQGANTAVNYLGDPIVIYGGLNAVNGQGAAATVGTTTKGSIKGISVANNAGVFLGGFGYSIEDSTQNQYGQINIINGGGAIANIGGVNTAIVRIGNSFYNPVSTISYIPNNRIGRETGGIPSVANAYMLFNAPEYSLHIGQSLGVSANATNYTWDGVTTYANLSSSNATSNLLSSLTFLNSFLAYPISTVIVLNQGGGLTATPTITASSLYKTDDTISIGDLGALGILGPIQINTQGSGYQVNDTIVISGGSGYGAYANVVSVNASGAITNVGYTYSSSGPTYPLGGMGYRLSALPTLSITSTAGVGATLSIAGIVGQGAQFTSSLDRVGSITSINISDYGQDYIAKPNVSFKVQDIIITNVSTKPTRGDIVYQGPNVNSSTYLATVDSVTTILPLYANTLLDLYTLRVYNYNSTPNIAYPLNSNTYSVAITNSYATTILSAYGGINQTRYANGVITYGDGTATGNASFLNGLTLGAGQYLDTSGQLSSFDVLQSTDYNNYTYEITLEKEIAKYRSALLNLLHPTGMKVRGRFAMKSNSSMLSTAVDGLQTGHTLYDYVGANSAFTIMSLIGDFEDLMSDPSSTEDLNTSSAAAVDLLLDQITQSSFTTGSTNIIQFGNIPTDTNIATFIFPNSSIQFTTANGRSIKSDVNTINYATNSITLKDNVWLSFANVANVTGSAGQNTINISNVYTSSYNLINNGIYTNAKNPLADIINVGDFVLVNTMISIVKSLNTTNNVITSITLNDNLTYKATGNLSVTRILSANAQFVKIFGALGTQYVPELITEAGDMLTTEDGNFILID